MARKLLVSPTRSPGALRNGPENRHDATAINQYRPPGRSLAVWWACVTKPGVTVDKTNNFSRKGALHDSEAAIMERLLLPQPAPKTVEPALDLFGYFLDQAKKYG